MPARWQQKISLFSHWRCLSMKIGARGLSHDCTMHLYDDVPVFSPAGHPVLTVFEASHCVEYIAPQCTRCVFSGTNNDSIPASEREGRQSCSGIKPRAEDEVEKWGSFRIHTLSQLGIARSRKSRVVLQIHTRVLYCKTRILFFLSKHIHRITGSYSLFYILLAAANILNNRFWWLTSH